MRKNKAENTQSEFSILALDDDPIMTATIQSYFVGAGYHVDIENDPVAAIERVRNGSYDILISDFLMSPICADEVVQRIRTFNHDIYIILLTGHKSMAPPIRTIRSLDIQGYFEKSERFDQLELLVESCVKSIRQMKLARNYQQGLAQMAELMPQIYSLQEPAQVGQRIFSGIPTLFQTSDRLLVIWPDEQAGQCLRYEEGEFFSSCKEKDSEALYDRIAACSEKLLFSKIIGSDGHCHGILSLRFETEPVLYQQQLFQLFVRQCASSLENTILTCRLKRNYMEIIQALRLLVDAKDMYTRGHSDRVAYYSEALARALGMNEQTCSRIKIAGQFHDIGKVAIPDQILLSPNRLTDEEFAVIRQHPLYSDSILSSMSSFRDILPIVRGHHERIDGRGYPDGLKADEIPLESRIISIADTFDAMTSTRRYRANLSLDEAIRRLKEAKGTQLDSHMVDVFLTLVEDDIMGKVNDTMQADPLEKKVQE